MSLEVLWFILVSVLWVGFFFLEGFDFGVGILQFFLGKNESERRTYIYSIGPHWDGNEVWLITAGGAIFAAFPLWYAALFSALYLPLVFLLLALIARGVCFEFRARSIIRKMRGLCDRALMASSLLCAVLVGVAMADLAIGIPINEQGNFTGNFFDLVKPIALLSGLYSLSLFLSSGALFLSLKIEGELQERACKISRKLILISAALSAAMLIVVLKHSTVCIAAFVFVLLSVLFVYKQFFRLAFVSLVLCIACSVAALFYEMFPNVLVSAIAENSLTVWNSSSSKYTLKIMSITAAIFLPVILGYQIWSYYIFRKRISPRNTNVEA